MNFNKKCSTQWQMLLFTMLLLFTMTLLTGCDARPGISSSRSVPTVSSTSPANASVNVARNTKITATFSETMDLSTVTSTSFLLMQGTSYVSGTVSYSGTTAVFTPADTLLSNTVYTATITTDVISAAGEPLASSVVWVFTTGAVVLNTPPTIITSDPLDEAVDVPLNQKIAATFSTEMNASTIARSTFLVSQGEASISGSVSYSGTTAVFAPSVNMSPNTTYTVTVTTGAEDLAGNALAENVSWSFTTGDSVVTTPPLVSATNPTDSATGVVLNQEITVTFSKTMDATTLTTTTFSLKNGTTAVAGFVTCSGTTATFSPADDLLPGVTYTGTVTTGVTDLAGNALETDYQWTFTTDTIAVIVLPVVVSVNPLDSAIDVIRTKVLTVEFSKTMDALTITTTSFTLKNGTTDVAGTVASVGTNATFSPTQSLLPSTTYIATITTAVKDSAGNALAANYQWTFTTKALPVVTSTNPLDSASDVVLDQTITVHFSTTMDTSSITSSSFTLKNGLTTVTGTLLRGGDTAVFTPSVDLLPSTTYTVTLTNAVKDSAGDSLASDYTWSFTTISLITSVLQSAATFGGFGGSAGLTNQGIYTVINGDIGTTAACTLVTGFHDKAGDVYTETPLNVGYVDGNLNCAPPAPGTATKMAIAELALNEATTAFNYFAGLPGGSDPGAGELGGLVLTPGTYTAASGSFGITSGNLTLDAQGDPNAQWVFQMASTLTVGQAGQARSVTLVNGAQAKNVMWQVGSAATINGAGGGTMMGTIISFSGVTFSTAGNVVLTTLNGRAISLDASVTMVNTVVNVQ